MEEFLKNKNIQVLDNNDFGEIVNNILDVYKEGIFDTFEKLYKDNEKKLSEISNGDKSFIKFFNMVMELFNHILDDSCDITKEIIVNNIDKIVFDFIENNKVEGTA